METFSDAEKAGEAIDESTSTTPRERKKKKATEEFLSFLVVSKLDGGGPPNKSVVLYAYNDKLHKQFVKDWFEGFDGYLHVDGDNFFDLIGDVVELVNCIAHARRKFEPIANGANNNLDYMASIRLLLKNSPTEAKKLVASMQERKNSLFNQYNYFLGEYRLFLDEKCNEVKLFVEARTPPKKN